MTPLYHQYLRRMFPDKRRKFGQDLDAYFAGFFDGEGCIMFMRYSEHKPWSVHVRVMVHNTNPAPIRLLKKAYGGTVSKWHRRPHKDIYEWRAVAKDAHWALCRMLPWLKIKRKKAAAAIVLLANLPLGKKGGTLTKRQKKIVLRMANKWPVRDYRFKK